MPDEDNSRDPIVTIRVVESNPPPPLCGTIYVSNPFHTLDKMVYCSKCGRENPSESKYCNGCGATLYDGSQPVQEMAQPSTYTAPVSPKTKSAGSKAAGIVIAVIAVLVVLAFVFSMVTGTGWFGGNAEAQINIRSTHVLNTVTVEVYADNIKIAEETLGPLKTKTITYKKYLLDDSQTITIKAVARGGGFGTMQDSKTVTLEKGEVVNVHLLV